MTRLQIATKNRIDRGRISRYLAIDGAPAADAKGRYSEAEVLRWIEANSKTAHGNTEIRDLNTKIKTLEAEDRAFDLGVKKGIYIERTEIVPAIAAFNTQLTADLQAKFEHELPAKYAGRSRQECAELNAAAVDFVLKRLKGGQTSLVGKDAAA